MIYGLKQARLEWFCTLQSHIVPLGYSQSGHDPRLYVINPESFILIYVNDILLFETKEKMGQMKSRVASKYEMCDLGEVQLFLAIEITHDQSHWTITIDQCQYVQKILECFGIDNA